MIRVREYLSEKFTEEESDPISDLGIGYRKYVKLKAGDIVMEKKSFRTKETTKYSKRLKIFFNIPSDEKLVPGVIVKVLRDYNNSKLTLFIIFLGSGIKQCKKLRNEILNKKYKFDPLSDGEFTFCVGKTTYKQWADYLKIIEQ